MVECKPRSLRLHCYSTFPRPSLAYHEPTKQLAVYNLQTGIDIYLTTERPVFHRSLPMNIHFERNRAMQIIFARQDELVVGTDNGGAEIWSLSKGCVTQTLTLFPYSK